MKKVLIISPHFPPVNAPDMHRVRQSLPYFKEFGWEAVVFAVDPAYVETAQDSLLVETLPAGTEIHYVKAWPARWTRKVGLGNLGIRSYLQLRRAVDRYLCDHRVDLIYFSTTVFVSMALGPHWKRKFGVPFVIDLQDPWCNDYYLQMPRHERPKKFWFDYRMNRYLEVRTVPEAAGIITVSPSYGETLRRRYSGLPGMPFLTLPFGILPDDFQIASRPGLENRLFPHTPGRVNIVYTGALPPNMTLSLSALFSAVQKGREQEPDLFGRLRFYFIGSSYARAGQGNKMAEPLARQYGIEDMVHEQEEREPYFSALRLLLDADLLLILGSTDTGYTASKLYPYILAGKPILALFNEKSSVVDILKKTGAGEVVTFVNDEGIEQLSERTLPVLADMLKKLPFRPDTDWDAFEPYTARVMTQKQCEFFEDVVISS